MDPFQTWKDDYRREVEDVIAARREARRRGEAPDPAPGEGFSGRLVDLVIPPAGAAAEAATWKRRAEGLRQETEDAVAAARLERERRERIKDAAARLAVELSSLRAELTL